MGRRQIVVVFLGSLLASCAHHPNPPVAPPAPPPPVVEQPPLPPPVPVPDQKPQPPRPVVKPPVKPAPPNPDELIGLDQAGVAQLLGAAAETRTEGLAQIMSYRTGSCAIDVVLLVDLKAGGPRVATYQIDDGQAQAQVQPHPATPVNCYGILRGNK